MKDMNWQAVVAGVGGQGVLFVTRVLAEAVRKRAKRILISEVHGMAQRGGAVVSHLKAGDFAGPLVASNQADLLLSLEPGEAVRNLAFLRPGGRLVVNVAGYGFLSRKALDALARHKVEITVADANTLARLNGDARAANVVLLAAAAAKGALPFSSKALCRVLMGLTPPARREANKLLFMAGAGLGQD